MAEEWLDVGLGRVAWWNASGLSPMFRSFGGLQGTFLGGFEGGLEDSDSWGCVRTACRRCGRSNNTLQPPWPSTTAAVHNLPSFQQICGLGFKALLLRK